MALTSELAVIQGPPGTGKTYVGLQIVKTLLINNEEKILPESPFLVLCYTNHALDQFLELLLNELPGLRVVPVGGQSKSEVVGAHSLFEHRKRLRRDLGSHLHDQSMKIQKSKEVNAFREVEHLQTLLADLTKEITQLSRPGGIFNFKDMVVGPHLETVLPPPLWETLQTSVWLEVWTENFLFPDFQIEEIIPQLFIVKPTVEPQAKPSGDLKMKLQKQNEGAEPKKKGNFVEEKHEKGEYDMDELLEHRIMETDDYFHTWMKTEECVENSTMFMYIDNCSIRECMNKPVVIINELKSSCMDYYSMENGNSNLYLRSSSSPMEMERRYQKLMNRIRDLRISQFELTNRTNLLSSIFTLYKEGRLEFPNVDKVFRKSQDGKYELRNKDVIKYPIRLEWGIYFKVVEIALEFAKKYRDEVVHLLENAKKEYAQELQKLDGCILRNSDIIGMTTTGAARMHGLLELAKPEIVIVEEAAEILEAHIVTSLTEECKHLILIGDHLQLQPSVNIFELETKYKLNVSLFERMILNGVPLCTLKTQHRMRPEISNLVVGTIYEELHDHETVHEYPTVRGIKKSLFFINHNQPEEMDPDLLSRSNRYEAEFLFGLYEYLLKQGYEHKQITILTTYTGQMFLLKKLISPTTCRDVRVTCVDNFQGEENDIILLSLVRSNEENKVGFVGKENRICVALSRARHGLFVVGNMDVLASESKTWRSIHKKLKDGQNIGPALELICKRHGKLTEVKNGNSFYPLVKGGCQEECGAILSCSHTCPQICHAIDQVHEIYNCMERCAKACALNHQCPSVCSRICPSCIVPVMKTLRCGHQEKIACHKDPDGVLCRVPVMRTLSCKLKHEKEVECRVDFTTLKCKILVEKVLLCLHVRMVECSVAPVDVKCDIENEKVLLPCRHKRVMKCYQSVDNVKCDVQVDKELPRCGHVKNMKCFKSVANEECSTVTDVVVPGCFHVMKLPCYKSANPKCTRNCGNMLSCGHKCHLSCHATRDPDHKMYKCKEKCQRSCKAGHPCKHPCHEGCPPCEEKVKKKLGCGHDAILSCHESVSSHNWKEVIEVSLICGHTVMAECGDVEHNRRMSNIILCKEMVAMKRNKCSDEIIQGKDVSESVSIKCCKKDTGVCKQCDRRTKMQRVVETTTLEAYDPPSKRRRIARNLFFHSGESGSTDRDYNGSPMRGNRWRGGNGGRGSHGKGGAKFYPINHLNWRR